MTVTASAPTRIDLAGGTIDIWPLYLFHSGAATVNAAISLRAHARVTARDDGRIHLVSEDTARESLVDDPADLPADTTLPLLARLVHAFHLRGLTLTTRGESPAGAGIAGSSALNVAVCGALARWSGRPLADDALLTRAQNVEAQVLGVPTGLQDYRPALHGGVAVLELGPDGARRVPLAIDTTALERRLILCYTGLPRNSGTNNWEITKRHIDGDAVLRGRFDRIRDTARAMRTALERADWEGVAEALEDEWTNRRALSSGVSTPEIDALVDAARRAGARAAKICGAGGGGCLICLAEPDAVAGVASALASGGARLLDFRIEHDGLRVTTPEA